MESVGPRQAGKKRIFREWTPARTAANIGATLPSMKPLHCLICLLALPGAAYAALGDRIAVANGEFRAGDRRIWINGANTPWHEWNDFGGRFSYAWWDSEFQSLHDQGINATRVWISCDGREGMEIDDSGRVSGATQAWWDNLDSLLEIARRHQVYVLATLLSFDHVHDNHAGYERWRRWLASDANIDSYVGNIVVPLVRRYRDTPWLWAIDLMNEPDWVHENKEDGQFAWERLESYFARAAVAIHRDGPILVTVGLAMPKYGSDTAFGASGNKVGDAALRARVDDPGARLDFYTTHYYDWCAKLWGPAPYLSPAEYHMPLDKPSVIGEMPAKGTEGHTTAQDYESTFEKGWQGAMGWTSDGVDENGEMDLLGPATSAFAARHPELVFPR
jgi:hypothetical protein